MSGSSREKRLITRFFRPSCLWCYRLADLFFRFDWSGSRKASHNSTFRFISFRMRQISRFISVWMRGLSRERRIVAWFLGSSCSRSDKLAGFFRYRWAVRVEKSDSLLSFFSPSCLWYDKSAVFFKFFHCCLSREKRLITRILRFHFVGGTAEWPDNFSFAWLPWVEESAS